MVNNNIKILFIHNVHTRYKTLLNNLELEKKHFPNSNSYVLYNQSDIDFNMFKHLSNVKFIFFNYPSHKLGCTNACTIGIQEAIKSNYDVIVFSHDDVMINGDYLSVVNQNIELIYSKKFDSIFRRPNSLYGNRYAMMEIFYISGDYADLKFRNSKLIENENDLPKDYRGSPSPEVFLYEALEGGNNKILNYEQELSNYNTVLGELLGYTHKNYGIRNWKE
jgi:hypothetical protein